LCEIIYRVERGGNYGWAIMEGPQPINTDLPPGPTPSNGRSDRTSAPFQ
jgi:hypothetical protein